MLWKILIAVVVLIGALLLYATTKPDQFSVVRTIDINASPAVVYAQLDDFKRWKDWSPWEKMDPAMQRTFSGSSSGVGSIYAWTGNDKVGQGQMEILKAEVPTSLVIKLDFIKPFEGHNVAEFTLVKSNGTTHVTWEMRGPNVFLGKLMGVFVDMDQMIGKDFETGLANLKQLAEQQPAAEPMQVPEPPAESPTAEAQPQEQPQPQ